MSALADEQPGLTFDEYLKFELNYAGDERFELDAGTVVMMAGGTERHDLMVTALFRALDRALDGGPCEVFPHNRKLRTSARSSFYPDLLVRCGKGTHPQYETDARFVIEVLSPSNHPADRTHRLFSYQSLESVESILFVDLDRRVVTVHERADDRVWGERQVFGGVIRLGAAELDFARLWSDVDSRVTTE